MKTPIELHFYNKDNEVIKTWTQNRITWKFFKKAVSFTSSKETADMNMIYEFVREFFGNRFSMRALKKYTDIEQLVAVAGQIVMQVLHLMQTEGIEFPNPEAVEKEKSRILDRWTGFLRSKK